MHGAIADYFLPSLHTHRTPTAISSIPACCSCRHRHGGGASLSAAEEGEEIPDAAPVHGAGAVCESLNPEGSAEGVQEAAVPRPLTGRAALEGIAAALVAALNAEQRLAVQR